MAFRLLVTFMFVLLGTGNCFLSSLIGHVLCPVSLPQDVSWLSPCKLARATALKVAKWDYPVQTPTESMPFARLRHGVLKLSAILIKDLFLKSHADKWRLLALSNEAIRAGYTLAHGSNNIMSMAEFTNLADFFKKHPRLLLTGYVKLPSEKEPFQKEMEKWISDEYFAHQRLAGTNSMSLKRITFSNEIGTNWNELKLKLNPKFDWKGAVSRALSGMQLKTAIDEGHLYVLYHPMADDLPTMEDDGDNDPERKMWKFMSPIAVFASVPGQDSSSEATLRPIAIQMDHKPESPVYTPKDGDLWTMAKLNVQLTDFETSQIVEHLCKVHLVSEGLCLVVERQLSNQHPFYVIMRFHCRGVLTANTYGGPVLLAKDNKLDNLFPYGYKGSNSLVAKVAKTIHWSNVKLKNNIEQRGVGNTDRLPYYPFRDDGAEIEKTIKGMVTAYVHAYYSSDADVRADNELKNFAREISDKGRGSKIKLRGFPASFNGKTLLIETFTRMIWLMTGQHASVNYPMVDYATYVPNLPLKLYDSERVDNTTFSPERLPNQGQSAAQASFAVTLASFRQDRLFDYWEHLKDNKGKQVVSRYFNHLNEVVAPLLEQRNRKRQADGYLTYPYMQPIWIPNGIQT